MIKKEYDENWSPQISKLVNTINTQENNLKTENNPTAFKLVLRVANVIDCLLLGIDSVTEISNICKVDKSTIHRLLKAMEQAGFIIKDPITHGYYIGPLITKIISNPNVTHRHLISCSLKEISYLWNLTNETIGLSVLTGVQSVQLYEIPSSFEHKISSFVNVAGKLHAGARTKVLLSLLDEKELKIAMLNMDFEYITENTITQKDKFIEQLKQIKQQGYAVSYGERIPEAISIAVPIRDYFIPAALFLIGPESRLTSRVQDYINELVACSIRIHSKLLQVNLNQTI
jgi:IclR family transcriptional regulator, KDG regulon repressor